MSNVFTLVSSDSIEPLNCQTLEPNQTMVIQPGTGSTLVISWENKENSMGQLTVNYLGIDTVYPIPPNSVGGTSIFNQTQPVTIRNSGSVPITVCYQYQG